MHEVALMRNVVARVQAVAQQAGARQVKAVRLRVGGGFSIAHLRSHWKWAAQGTSAQGARLTLVKAFGGAPGGDDLVLDSIEVEPTCAG
jgi:Zn finger protein HypA/HybF involved in hydrogenase expression